MLHETQPNTNTCCENDCKFGKFAEWFKPAATALVNSHLEKESEGRLLFLKKRSGTSLYEAWIKAFKTPELIQEHTCHACKRYLNGIGSLGIITDDFTVEPFAIPAIDDSFKETVPSEYHAPYDAIVKAINNNGWDIPLAQDIDDKSDVFGTEYAGGWSHMALDYSVIKRSKLNDVFKRNFAKPDGTGLGPAEISTTQDWLGTLLAMPSLNLPLDKIRKTDMVTYDRIVSAVELAKTVDRSIFVRASLIVNGLGLLRTRNTVIGALLEDISKGISMEAALKAYNKYTDPRNYMRPTRLPSEGKFEQDVAFLTENGYDKYMPMRLATLDDLREYNLLFWERNSKTEEVAEVAKPKDIFAKARNKIKESNNTAGNKEITYANVGTEQVSMAYFVNEVLADASKIADVIFEPRTFNWGSYGIPHVTEGNNIFEDGIMVRPFISSRQIYDYNASSYYSLENKNVQALRISKDSVTGDNVLNIIYDECKWNIALITPLFASGLIKPLRDRRVTIEHFMTTNPMNVDEEGVTVVKYDNTLLSIPLLVGHSIKVRTTDGFERTYNINSVK